MSNIQKLSLKDPNVDLMIIENAYIKENKIDILKKNKKDIFYPTMYKSWCNKINEYIIFEEKDSIEPVDNNEILIIFDSFGLSSYYHLLIDTIIPVWITKKIVSNYLNLNTNYNYNFLNISDKSRENKLKNANNIFKYFLNNNYTDYINNKYKYIIYGYCYDYRPYHGPFISLRYFPKYQFMFDAFYDTFSLNENNKEKYIVIASRSTRSYRYMNTICDIVSKYYTTKIVDFSEYSIEEQIEISKNAWAIIGSEGAAFSNQIFMEKKSLLICIGETHKFHSSLSQYLEHDFYNLPMESENCVNDILDIIKKFTSLS